MIGFEPMVSRLSAVCIKPGYATFLYVPSVGNDPTLNRLEVSYKKNSYEGESYQCGFSTPI